MWALPLLLSEQLWDDRVRCSEQVVDMVGAEQCHDHDEQLYRKEEESNIGCVQKELLLVMQKWTQASR